MQVKARNSTHTMKKVTQPCPNYPEGSQIYLPFHGSSKPIYDIHQLQSYYQRHIYYLYFVVNDNPNLNFSGSHI